MGEELKVISDFYDLVCNLCRRIEKFPRQHRYSLGTEVERRLQTILGLLLRAKYASGSNPKRTFLTDVNVELEILRFQLRLAKDLTVLSLQGHGHTVALIEQIGNQVGGWMKALR